MTSTAVNLSQMAPWCGWDSSLTPSCFKRQPSLAPVGTTLSTSLSVRIFSDLGGLNHGVWTPMGMASVNSLEDIIGGHLWIGVILLGGGAWHILVTPKAWVGKMLRIEANAILSYNLGGLALMALASCAFIGFNTTAFPGVAA
jgi:Photosystem II protein